MDDSDEPDSFKALQVREVAAREQEVQAQMIEAKAASERAKTETNILSITANATLLRERKKLCEEGISQEN